MENYFKIPELSENTFAINCKICGSQIKFSNPNMVPFPICNECLSGLKSLLGGK